MGKRLKSIRLISQNKKNYPAGIGTFPSNKEVAGRQRACPSVTLDKHKL